MAREFGRPSSFKHLVPDSGRDDIPSVNGPIYSGPAFVAAKRGSDILRSLPVLFVVLLVVCLYTIFFAFHCLPLLQIDLSAEMRDADMFRRGIIEITIFHIAFILFCISYILVVITPAGTIPNSPEWVEGTGEPEQLETKREGTRRFCKWCEKYKPDRAHHCRQCRRCVLKMDHHCPWIYNCVGWGNHKYFILTLFYATISTLLIVGFQVESVKAAIDEPQIRFGVVFLLLFGESIASLLALLCVGFFSLHFWLIINNLSTIEFCEKRFRRPTGSNVYNRGCLRNVGDAFGRNPFLIFLPIDNRTGDGLHFKLNSDAQELLHNEQQHSQETQPLTK